MQSQEELSAASTLECSQEMGETVTVTWQISQGKQWGDAKSIHLVIWGSVPGPDSEIGACPWGCQDGANTLPDFGELDQKLD